MSVLFAVLFFIAHPGFAVASFAVCNTLTGCVTPIFPICKWRLTQTCTTMR